MVFTFKSRSRVSCRGFTLFELLIVLALLAVLVGLIAGAVGGLSRRNDSRAALTAALDALTLARIDAMRSARPRTVSVAREGERLVIVTDPGTTRSVRAAEVTPVSERAVPAAQVARFDGSGRTDSAAWRLALAAPAPQGTIPEGARIWRVEFDPISGAPSLIDPASERATNTKASQP